MSNIERHFVGCSRDIFHRNIEDDEPFCTQENWQSSVVFLNQEVELIGLSSICSNEDGQSQLDVISLVNVTWQLIQSHKEKLKKISDLETQIRKMHSDASQMHNNIQRLRDLIEYKERQAGEAEAKEKQALAASKQIHNELKATKEETKRLSSMIVSRENRFNHEAKKKEADMAKLKDRLLKTLSEAKAGNNSGFNPISIEVIGDPIDKPDGKPRGRWRNETEDQKRGDELLQRAIDAYQEREEALTQEVEKLKNTLSVMLSDMSKITGQQFELNTLDLPGHFEDVREEWRTKLRSLTTKSEKSSSSSESPREIEKNQEQFSKLLSEHFTLDTFVPLSEVRHVAPPAWVSRAQCTLPPTGKAETVKLRTITGESKPRPRSSHLSPYRGMQVQQPAASQNQALYKSVKNGSRCGSMSPTSASPTRMSKGDTRSLPRMTGSKLSLRRTSQSQTSSANNSSADESTGPTSTYKRIVGRRLMSRPSSSRALSPEIMSPAESESESCNELSHQLKKLGKYLERKQSRSDIGSGSEVLDPEMDEHLVNIRKALASKK